MLTSATVPRRPLGSLNPGVCSPLRAFPNSSFHTSLIHSRGKKPRPASDPVLKFFARFPDFKYDPNTAWPGEWKRLREELEEQLQRAAIERFHATYSFNRSDLAAWQKICRVLGIFPAQTLEGCREAIKTLYVYTVDLEHEGHLGNAAAVPRFPNEVKLGEYSRKKGRLYRKDLVPQKSLLKLLQRHFLNYGPEGAENPMHKHRKRSGKQESVGSNQSKRSG